jgi:ParB family transcriptional regulator, chromosome partitioning protein
MDKNKRKSLGRSVDLSPSASIISSGMLYTLSTGRKVKFYRSTIPAGQVESVTYPHEMNMRIAEDLTRASLEILISSISRQQYQPVIAQRIGGRYATMDGSRRRQSAIYAGVGLDVVYCDEELTKAEVKSLSKELQSSKEHSVRENGQSFQKLLDENPTFTQESVAVLEGFTQGYVSKALQAWSLPQELINLYEFPGDITLPQFAELAKVIKHLEASGKQLDEFVAETKILAGTSNDEVTELIKESAGVNKGKISAEKAIKFVTVSTKKWANSKRVKDKTTITLNRASESEYELIKAYITKVMSGT